MQWIMIVPVTMEAIHQMDIMTLEEVKGTHGNGT